MNNCVNFNNDKMLHTDTFFYTILLLNYTDVLKKIHLYHEDTYLRYAKDASVSGRYFSDLQTF